MSDTEYVTLRRTTLMSCVRALIVGAALLIGLGAMAGYYASTTGAARHAENAEREQRVNAVSTAKDLGESVYAIGVCESTDPVDVARFSDLCRRAQEAIAQPGADGRDGKDGRPGKDGRDGQDGLSPPCLSEPNQCRGEDGKDGEPGKDGAPGRPGAQGPQGAQGPAGESNPCPGRWESAVLTDGRNAYLCIAGAAQGTN